MHGQHVDWPLFWLIVAVGAVCLLAAVVADTRERMARIRRAVTADTVAAHTVDADTVDADTVDADTVTVEAVITACVDACITRARRDAQHARAVLALADWTPTTLHHTRNTSTTREAGTPLAN